MSEELRAKPSPLPPPLRSIGISGLGEILEIIYGLQSLTGKILKALAFGCRLAVDRAAFSPASCWAGAVVRAERRICCTGDPSLRRKNGSGRDDAWESVTFM